VLIPVAANALAGMPSVGMVGGLLLDSGSCLSGLSLPIISRSFDE
jgi:hypothetical protein